MLAVGPGVSLRTPLVAAGPVYNWALVQSTLGLGSGGRVLALPLQGGAFPAALCHSPNLGLGSCTGIGHHQAETVFFAFLTLLLGPAAGKSGISVFLGPWIRLHNSRGRELSFWQGRSSCPRKTFSTIANACLQCSAAMAWLRVVCPGWELEVHVRLFAPLVCCSESAASWSSTLSHLPGEGPAAGGLVLEMSVKAWPKGAYKALPPPPHSLCSASLLPSELLLCRLPPNSHTQSTYYSLCQGTLLA